VRAGLAPLFKFIHKYYEPSFFDLFMHPRNYFGVYEAVLNVLSGGNWVTMPWRVRVALRIPLRDRAHQHLDAPPRGPPSRIQAGV